MGNGKHPPGASPKQPPGHRAGARGHEGQPPATGLPCLPEAFQSVLAIPALTGCSSDEHVMFVAASAPAGCAAVPVPCPIDIVQLQRAYRRCMCYRESRAAYQTVPAYRQNRRSGPAERRTQRVAFPPVTCDLRPVCGARRCAPSARVADPSVSFTSHTRRGPRPPNMHAGSKHAASARTRVVLAATRSWPVRPVTSPEERGASSLTLTLRPIHARLGAACGGDRPQSVHPGFSAVQQKPAVKPAAQLTACVACTACTGGAHSSAPAQ